MLPIQINKTSTTPVYQQIATAIRELIARRVLQAGDRLPTTRELARQLEVNRTTVISAYREIAASGVADATVGRGTFVLDTGGETRQRGEPIAADASPSPHAGPTPDPSGVGDTSDGDALRAWRPNLSRAIQSASWYATRETEVGVDHPEVVDFAALAPDEELFPIELMRPIFDRLLAERGRELLQYGGSQGERTLREFIAQDLERDGINVGAGEILIVNGIQQGIDLTLRVLIDPGDVVIVESPTYMSILTSVGLYRAEIAEVPMTRDGLDVSVLERVMRTKRPKLLYTMPNFQNPTGVSMSSEVRERVVELASQHEVPILEDDYEKDLRFIGAPEPALKSLDRRGLVIHMGTFSKGLFPGLRLGWMAAPPALVPKLNLAKRAADLHTSSLIQAAVAEFCISGHYHDHMRKLQRVYTARQQTILDALDRHFPAGVSWTRPHGGFVVWVTLPDGFRVESVLEDVRQQGVLATPGTFYFAGDRGGNQLRLSFSRTDPSSIERGIKILGTAIARRLGDEARREQAHPGRRTLPHL